MSEQNGSTTSTGAPAVSDRNSLTLGANGPILLHDVLGSYSILGGLLVIGAAVYVAAK